MMLAPQFKIHETFVFSREFLTQTQIILEGFVHILEDQHQQIGLHHDFLDTMQNETTQKIRHIEFGSILELQESREENHRIIAGWTIFITKKVVVISTTDAAGR